MKHSRALCIAAVLSAAACAGRDATFRQTPDRPQTARAFAVAYADGRISYTYLHPEQREGGFWTPMAPHVPGMDTARDGLLLKALDVRHVLEGTQVNAKISLLYGNLTAGSPGQKIVEVATVSVNPAQWVHVDALTSYGVQPVTLWITDVPPVVATAPAVETTSDRLGVRIEAISGAVPAFRIFVTNHSQMVLRSFRVRTYRGGHPAGSSGVGGMGESALLQPGATHTVYWRPPIHSSRQGTPEWTLPDRVVIESTIWSDK